MKQEPRIEVSFLHNFNELPIDLWSDASLESRPEINYKAYTGPVVIAPYFAEKRRRGSNMHLFMSQRARPYRVWFSVRTSLLSNVLSAVRRRSVLLLLGTLQLGTSSLVCQSNVPSTQVAPSSQWAPYTRIFGTEDAEIQLPPQSVALGRKDAGAVLAVQRFISVSNVDGVNAIKATGTLQDTGSAKPAMLLYTSDNAMRLDVSDDKGQRSFRVERARATIMEASGKKHSLPPATAAVGVVVTPFLPASHMTDTQASFIDQGIVAVDGINLHRITMAYPANPDVQGGQSLPTSVVDLYFDDASHYLVASATCGRLDSRDRADYLQVISYQSYSPEGGVNLPHDYRVSLNGQRQWALHLSNFLSNPSITNGSFHF